MSKPPYGAKTVPFMRVVDGQIEWTCDRWKKVEMCRSEGDVSCAWPGQWSTSVFEVDKSAALRALGGDDAGYPALGTRFTRPGWRDDGAIETWEITEVLDRGGRPSSARQVKEDGSFGSGISFGTAQAWRGWYAEVTDEVVPA
jgi:hypothetical protein